MGFDPFDDVEAAEWAAKFAPEHQLDADGHLRKEVAARLLEEQLADYADRLRDERKYEEE